MAGAHVSFAELLLPSGRDLLAFGVPVLVLAALGWLIFRTDRLMHAAFPHLEWEQSLGWLNIRAERRAHRGLRWVGYGITVLLIDALFGIFWAAKGLPRLADWSDPWVMGELALRVPAGVFCLLIWILYLGLGLLPRLRAEREAAAYRKFRRELQIRDEEKGAMETPARGPEALPKSRPQRPTSPATLTPRRHWRQFPPGG
jgi:hypothetical protein